MYIQLLHNNVSLKYSFIRCKPNYVYTEEIYLFKVLHTELLKNLKFEKNYCITDCLAIIL